MRAGDLSNYAFGHTSAAAGLGHNEMKAGVQVVQDKHAIPFGLTHLPDLADPEKKNYIFSKFFDNPLDQKAIDKGYYDYFRRNN